MVRVQRFFVTAVLAFLAGCSGAILGPGLNGQTDTGAAGNPVDPTNPPPDPIGSAGGGQGSGYTPGGGVPTTPPQCNGPQPGRSPLRRLTRAEYNNTVRDLLGDATAPANAMAADAVELSFDNNADVQTVSPLLLNQYLTVAEGVATRATQTISKILPCDPASVGEAACAGSFVDQFGRRAYRRPLTATERTSLLSLYTAGRAAGTFADGIRYVVTAALMSSQFLYRPEFGTNPGAPGSVVALTPWELASRLSYLLWASTPDDALLDAASKGQLATAQDLAAQATRMLADKKARDSVRHFFSQWLDLEAVATLDKDATLFPSFNAALASSMRGETEAFIDEVFWAGSGTVGDLFTSSFTFIDSKNAPLYGLTSSSSTLKKTSVDAVKRAGLLTQPSLLSVYANADQSSPVARGKFVRERLLCQSLPPPPQNINITLPALDPKLTTRERFSQHSTDAACSGCHRLMDPIGFGFENFDALGRWRDTESGKPVNSNGTFVATRDLDGDFAGAVDLARRVSKSEEVNDCMVLTWFRYGAGRGETTADACSLYGLRTAFKASGGNLRELLKSMTQTDAFRYRLVAAP